MKKLLKLSPLLLSVIFISVCSAEDQYTNQSTNQDTQYTNQNTTSQDTNQSTDQNTNQTTPDTSANTHNSGVGQYISDSTITAKVKADLLADKDISSLSISVKTKKGQVTLTGHVPDKTQKQKIVQITKGIDGVKSVVDKLVIKK